MSKVSVIVPAYNAENYIGKCIESIINQTKQDIEIIVVDDGSQDRTGEIMDDYARKDGRIRTVHKRNGGLVSARKAGVRIAESEYIGFVDADDWINSSMYEELLYIMEREKADLVASGVTYYYANGKEITYYNPVKEGCYRKKDIVNKIYPKMTFGPEAINASLCLKLFRKTLLLPIIEATNDAICCAEDVVIAYRYIALCEKIYFLDKSYYFYRQNHGSMCHKKQYDVLMQINSIVGLLRKDFSENKDSKILMETFNKLVAELLMYSYGFLAEGQCRTEYCFPYTAVRKGAKIVIYCAGAAGCSYYNQILRNGYCEVVLWADKRWETLDNPKADNPKKILEAEYEYIIVAISDAETASDIKKELVEEYGVPPYKIIAEKALRIDEVIRYLY